MNFNRLYNFISESFLPSFLSGVDFQFRSVSVSISIICHAGLFFRSYSGNLPAMFFNSSFPSMIPATIDFSISVISLALQLKFLCVTSFALLLGQLRDLPH